MANKLIECKACGAEMAASAKACPKCGARNKKPIYKRWWLWVLVIIVVIGIAGGGDKNAKSADNSTVDSASAIPVENETIPTAPVEKVETQVQEDSISSEYKAALKKAKSYSDLMHMSKAGIYDQLVSEYGEKFPADAAQYAIDNLDADYYANALAKAKSYQETMDMSRAAIYNQLISEYGEKFTADEAQYAIDHLA